MRKTLSWYFRLYLEPPAWYFIWQGYAHTKYQCGDIAPRSNTRAVLPFRAIYQNGVTRSRSNTRKRLSCLCQIPGRCYLYQGGVITQGRKTRMEFPHSDQIQGRGFLRQIKYRGRRPLLEQLPDGVISTGDVLSFRSKIPDLGYPFRSNTRDWIRPSNQIPGRSYPLGAKYQSGVTPPDQIPGGRVPSPGRIPGLFTPSDQVPELCRPFR